jgi:hypothetical protein
VVSTFWGHGFKELQLLPAVDMLWRQAWNSVRRDSSPSGS